MQSLHHHTSKGPGSLAAGHSSRCSCSLQALPVLPVQQQPVQRWRRIDSGSLALSSSSSSRPARAVSAAASAAAGVVSTSATPTQQRQPGGTKRRLILLRHADSETSANLRDYDRPISMQGKREAAKIAQQLCSLGWVPDLIIASNSKRTKQTLDVMVEASSELALVDAHYLGSLYTVAALDGQTKHHLEETIRSMASDAQNFCVMCVGHNKGWEEAASAFAKQAVRLSTASAALFETAGSTWEDVTSPDADWALVCVVTP